MKIRLEELNTLEAKRVLHIDDMLLFISDIDSILRELVNDTDQFPEGRDEALAHVELKIQMALTDLRERTEDIFNPDAGLFLEE